MKNIGENTEDYKARLIREQNEKFEKNYQLLHGKAQSLENTTLFCDYDKCRKIECRYHRTNIRGNHGITLINLHLSDRCDAETARSSSEKTIARLRKHKSEEL